MHRRDGRIAIVHDAVMTYDDSIPWHVEEKNTLNCKRVKNLDFVSCNHLFPHGSSFRPPLHQGFESFGAMGPIPAIVSPTTVLLVGARTRQMGG